MQPRFFSVVSFVTLASFVMYYVLSNCQAELTDDVSACTVAALADCC